MAKWPSDVNSWFGCSIVLSGSDGEVKSGIMVDDALF
jgi:hypothetical protein